MRREGAVVLCGLDMWGLTTGTFHQGPEDLCLLCSLVGAVWRKQERGGGVILKKAKSHRILLSLKKNTYIICSKSHFFIKFAKLWHFNYKILNHYHITFWFIYHISLFVNNTDILGPSLLLVKFSTYFLWIYQNAFIHSFIHFPGASRQLIGRGPLKVCFPSILYYSLFQLTWSYNMENAQKPF